MRRTTKGIATLTTSEAIQKEALAARIEKAKDLLNFWAFSLWTLSQPAERRRVHPKVGYVGQSIVTQILSGKRYNPFCFKTKTNAKQTRPGLTSKIPIGGDFDENSNIDRASKICEILEENFSEMQIRLLYALFVPPCAYSESGERRLTDAQIAKVANFKPPRACKIKMKAIELVVVEMLSPIFEE